MSGTFGSCARRSRPRDELISRNVAKLVQIPAPIYEVGQGLSVADARELLRAAQTERLSALYVVAIYLGLRRAELLGLQWEDLDLEAGTLQVLHTHFSASMARSS